MTTLLLAFGAMLTIIVGMAVGVLFGRQPIKGSCGGMSAVGIDAECEICGGNPARCESNLPGAEGQNATSNEQQPAKATDLGYRAET